MLITIKMFVSYRPRTYHETQSSNLKTTFKKLQQRIYNGVKSYVGFCGAHS